jgi:fluoride exporter
MLFKDILLVGLGGGVGSVARFLCQRSVSAWYPHAFPFGTLIVNFLGCLLIGLLLGLMEKGNIVKPELKLLLITGFCGGYTTFSAFAAENIQLLRDGRLLYFTIYTVGSVVLGILAAYAGLSLVK